MLEVEVLPDRPYTENSTYYDAYWQTLCSSILPPRASLHPQDQKVRTSVNAFQRSWHDSWWEWISKYDAEETKTDLVSPDFTGAEITAFDNNVLVSTSLRHFFLSRDENWMGFAPMDSEAEDIIALLEGGRVPYILRPKVGMEEGYYELIGDAYVHGIMDGEAWKPDLLQEIILV
jgi:hypothetical protein